MRGHLLLVAILTGLLSSCKDYPTEPINDWTHLSDFPGTPRASATSFVVGDKAYICLGRSGGNGSGFLNDLWEFNSVDSSWTRKANLPESFKARVKAVAGVIGLKAYVGMGAVSPYVEPNKQFNDFWEYDTQTDTWTRKADFPGEGKNDLFCTVVDGCLYTAMGYTGDARLHDTYKYDPSSNLWTKLPRCPGNYNNPAGFSIGHDFYVGSGFNGSNHNEFYRFQTQLEKWSQVADLPDARILSSGVSINDKGYVLLGRYWNGALNGGRLLSDIVEYDPAENSWTKRGSFPGGARQNAIVFSINGKGYVVGGEDDAERKSDVWMFRP